jgi:anaerobic ribonucleoside-triphosphate reductase activating protein
MTTMQHSTATILKLAQVVPCTEAEGPGKRFAIWFQGCPLRCPECCNPEMLSFTAGYAVAVHEVVEQITRSQSVHCIEGLTFLGGEPLAHATGAVALARAARAIGLSTMVFSGYTLAEIRLLPDPDAQTLLTLTDILVDGPYHRELPETRRRWIGSANQQVHFLSPRYDEHDPCWLLPNTLEIRLHGDALTVNGFPGRQAVGLWKRR